MKSRQLHTKADDPTISRTGRKLFYPQVGLIVMNPENGGHSAMPVLDIPMPAETAHYADGAPQKKNLLIVSSESTANNCFGQAVHEAWIVDITNEAAPWPISTLNVPQFPGDFCRKGARFGAHAVTDNAAMNDYVESDDRGYVYAADRAGSGVTILSLTGEASKVVAPTGNGSP